MDQDVGRRHRHRIVSTEKSHRIMGIICSTDETLETSSTPNPHGFKSDQKQMDERNRKADLQRMEDRALKEAMRQSARTASQENIDNRDVFASETDV